uniref:Transmembrane BAX inhibitor motif containing 6 n=1 Tax=Anas platyrhynchos platyrhynchos TaxID=8840 RepID=A0A493TXP7_ANAPP
MGAGGPRGGNRAAAGDDIRAANGGLAQSRFPAASGAPPRVLTPCSGLPRSRHSPQGLHQGGGGQPDALPNPPHKRARRPRSSSGLLRHLGGGGKEGRVWVLVFFWGGGPKIRLFSCSLHLCEAVSLLPAGTMNVFERNINFDALFKFSHISASTQEHLKRVYASFALCMLVAALGAYINVVTHLFQFSLLTGLGSLGLMIWLTATPHSRETEQKRLGMLAGFAFLTGINLGPLLQMCIAINPSIIPTAFLGTATVFACFSLSALYARRRSFLYLGGFLLSGLTLMLLSSLVNAFVGSAWLFTVSPASHRPPPKPGAISGPPPRAQTRPPQDGILPFNAFFPSPPGQPLPGADAHVRLRALRHAAHHREGGERRQGL